MSASEAPGVPLFPPWDFVQRFNACPARCGMPYLTGLDPLVMLAWHLASQQPTQVFLLARV